MTNHERVIQEIIKLVSENPAGVRYSILHKKIAEKCPDISHGSINGSLWRFRTHLPAEIYIPSKGLYKHIKFKDNKELSPEDSKPAKPASKIDEEHFYKQFAEWIVNELEECTKAISLGGKKFGDKWGTPDVIGVREPRKSDIIKPPTEIIAAEIKTDSQALIVAFGQACSYKLFSHRSYIVIPDDALVEDLAATQ